MNILNLIKSKLFSLGLSKDHVDDVLQRSQAESRVQIFGVYDKAAKHFLAPFFLVNKEVAIRTFAAGVNHPESRFKAKPLDYDLYHLGSFNDESGAFDNFAENVFLINASELISQPSEVSSNV